MPIYEFYCDSCGHEFEKIVSFSATQAPDCPSCAADTVSRRVSRPAIHFKGSGWYITDSKKGNGNGNGSANGSSTNGSSAKTETTSESPAKAESSESPTTTKSESSSEKATVKTDT